MRFLVAQCAAVLAIVACGIAHAGTLLMADTASGRVFRLDTTKKVVSGVFCETAQLNAGPITSIVVSDDGKTVYIAFWKGGDGSDKPSDGTIYRFPVQDDGTAGEPELFYTHSLGRWGLRYAMTMGPDRNGDGVRDLYVTVPEPAHDNESVYWIDAVKGQIATPYQEALGWSGTRGFVVKPDGTLARTVDSDGHGTTAALLPDGRVVGGIVGVLRLDNHQGEPLRQFDPDWNEHLLTNNTDYRIRGIAVGTDATLYWSSTLLEEIDGKDVVKVGVWMATPYDKETWNEPVKFEGITEEMRPGPIALVKETP